MNNAKVILIKGLLLITMASIGPLACFIFKLDAFSGYALGFILGGIGAWILSDT